MNFTYVIILVAVLVICPVVLKLASAQNKKTKQNIRSFFLLILFAQIILGFLNWENFSIGRSGFELALNNPASLLMVYFLITTVQIILLAAKLNTWTVVLSFVNSIWLFASLIRLSGILGFQAVSLASIGAVFLVLFGNVLGLILINKDKNLFKKYKLL